MKKIKWAVSLDLVGCDRSGTFEIEDDATDEEIEEYVKEEMSNYIDFHWEHVLKIVEIEE